MNDMMETAVSPLEQARTALDEAMEEDQRVGEALATCKTHRRQLNEAIASLTRSARWSRSQAEATEARRQLATLQQQHEATTLELGQLVQQRTQQCARLQAAMHAYRIVREKAQKMTHQLRFHQHVHANATSPYDAAEAQEHIDAKAVELAAVIGSEAHAFLQDRAYKPAWLREA